MTSAQVEPEPVEPPPGRAPSPYIDPETGQDIGIRRFAISRDWDFLTSGGPASERRYQSSVLLRPDRPAPTVTAMGGTLSSAGIMHPTECRRLNLLELRRLCGFPDDYILTGSYAERWARLGNAVPPTGYRRYRRSSAGHRSTPNDRGNDHYV